MAALKQRHNKWEARVRIPKAAQEAHGGKAMLYRTLRATSKRAAKIEAMAWEAELRAEWEVQRSGNNVPLAALRGLYESIRQKAGRGEFVLQGDRESFDEVTAGIEYELAKLAEGLGSREPTEVESVRVAALQDAKEERQRGRVEPRLELEMSFRELADEYLRLWRTKAGLKETNTEQQKKATFDLFACFFGSKPIRQVRRGDAAQFVDALRQMDPNWARTGKARGDGLEVTWTDLQRRFGGRDAGLSDATVNRHMATLSAFWKWAEEREHSEGRNPFDGHRRNLKQGRNKQGYIAWETEELRALFSPPPKREDLTEVMLVALYTGMRLNEIVSLTKRQVREENGCRIIDVTDAKTEAGIRKVPLHPQLGWLAQRASAGEGSERVWPDFSDEGPGKKPGGDAGKEFSRFKRGRGFEDRRKVFHSFRKNFVGQLEEAGVPENEVAVLVGHEKPHFTFKTYSTADMLKRLAAAVTHIAYPDVPLPKPK